MKPILYPLQIVSGGGRARGFRVMKYLPWSTLPTFRQTDVWKNILCLYSRLAIAYDHFYRTLGFLSPEIKSLLEELQKSYVDSYQSGRTPEYARTYASMESLEDIAETYSEDDYPQAYAYLLINPVFGGVSNE